MGVDFQFVQDGHVDAEQSSQGGAKGMPHRAYKEIAITRAQIKVCMLARSFFRGTMFVSFGRGVPPCISAANLTPIVGPICRGQAAPNYSRDRKGLSFDFHHALTDIVIYLHQYRLQSGLRPVNRN